MYLYVHASTFHGPPLPFGMTLAYHDNFLLVSQFEPEASISLFQKLPNILHIP